MLVMSKKLHNKRKRQMASDSKETDEDDDENGEYKSIKQKKRKKPEAFRKNSISNKPRPMLITENEAGEEVDNYLKINKNTGIVLQDTGGKKEDSCERMQSTTYDEEIYNCDINKPFDLSTKPKSTNLESNGIGLCHEKDKSSSGSDDGNESESAKLGFQSTGDLENSSISQELILAHLSKIQQNFVSNLLQYQASFMAHYQQFQQQMMSKASDESSAEDSNDKQDDNCSDREENQSSFLSSANLLRNLIPFTLYPNLLPITSTSGSVLPNFNITNPFSNANSTPSLSIVYKGDSDSEQESSDEISALKENVKRSNETAQLNTESSAIDKYSILESLIGASKEKCFTSSFNNENDISEEIDNSSNLQNKRKRIAFSAKQYELLQTTFEHNNFPEPGDQQCIARQLKAPYRSIKMWFQNKRANARKKLLPGEKGSGRTPTGEKIPGDTDTRFYCDKCPSAFICQIFLSNHVHAHTLYTKSCPKCRVTFTHDCLLTTHTLAKCGKKDDKIQEESKENDDQIFDLKFLTKLKTANGEANLKDNLYQNGNGYNASMIPSSILSQLKSTLPLLTLLQIQKKQEEQKREELSEQMDNERENDVIELDAGSINSTGEPNDYESSDEDKLEIDECKDTDQFIKVERKPIPKDLPPLIPTEFVSSENGDTSKFAILRQLLTNYQPNNNYSKKSDILDKSDNSNDNVRDRATCINNADDDIYNGHKLPQNIPKHLYQLLDSQIDINRSAKVEEFDETITESEENRNKEADNTIHNIKKEMDPFVEKRKHVSDEDAAIPESKFIRGPKAKRLRRRTTVFTENQHRILYLHFTHCNFPDPAMFRILSKLTGLTPHVIKIWFQNERSRQRRQVATSEEVIKEKKPYKCRDCGVEFAMPAFLVKHCMRHIPTDNVTSQARKCPICMVEFETQKLHSHFMASHNLSVTMEEEGTNEKNICHLCQELFPDLNSLSTHKNEHLKDTHYGDPPQCSECKTTFVNVLCLEAHIATHDKFTWEHSCMKCKMKFYDKILLESHIMTHNISNNYNDCSNESALNQSHLVSLSQQIASETKHKPILPKEEIESSVDTYLQSESENFAQSSLKSNSKKLITNIKTPPSKTGNVSFKLIPVKFIPLNSSQPNSISKSTNISSTSRTQINVLSPPTMIIKKEKKSKTAQWQTRNGEDAGISPPHIKESIVKVEKGLKEVPNLIPISESFAFKPFDFVGLGLTPIEPEKEGEEITDEQAERKTGDSSASSVSSDLEEPSDSSQVLLYTPYASEYRKRRRTPTHFNSHQRDILEAYYKYDNFPDPNEQLHLSEYLQVPYSVIKTWFQNTRKNHRKHLKGSTTSEVGGPFECSECRVCFVSKIYIDSHIRQHQEKQPFQCGICNLQFPHLAVHEIHLKMGCSKKSKKKHDHIRQFSSATTLNKFPKDASNKKQEIGLCLFKGEFNVSNLNSPNMKFISLQQNEQMEPFYDEKHYEGYDVAEEDSAHNLLLLSKVGTEYKERSIDSTVSSSSDVAVASDGMIFDCIQCSSQFSSSDLLSAHIKNAHVIKEQENLSYVPQIVGYTCPQCSKTFQSFIEIAEHKVNLNCSSPVRDSKSIPSEISPRKPLLTYSKLFDLYNVPCSKSLPYNTVPSKCTTVLNSASDCVDVSSNSQNTKRIKLKCANLNFLKLHYQHNNFPSSKEINLMSKKLCVDRERVAHWFQKQRTRERKGNSVGYNPPQQCKSCSSVFVHHEALKLHQQSVHNPSAICIQFICPFENCKMKYPNSTLLQTHQMSHEEKKDSKKTDLKFHGSFLEAHYSENNFPSPMDVGFIARRLNIEPLCVHWWFKERRARHLINLEKKPKIYQNSSVVELSNVTLEKSPSTTKECEVCDSAFLDQSMLQKHLSMHASDLSLVCFECGDDFANPLVFETHMVHHGIKPTDDVFSLSKCINLKSVVKFKYTFLQLQVLWNHYKQNNFAKKDEVKLLSRRLKIPMKHVQTWYKNQKLTENDSSVNSATSLKSTSVNGSIAMKQNQENFNVKCFVCSTEFASKHHMQCHLLVHKLGCSFSCDACSKTFGNEVIRDTHSLSHYSGLGLKAKVKALDKDLRTALKKLINDCKDAALFSVASSNGLIYEDDSLSGSEIFDDDHNSFDSKYVNHERSSLDEINGHEPLNSSSDDFEHLSIEVSSPTKVNEHADNLCHRNSSLHKSVDQTHSYEDFNECSILQIDHIDEDADINTEDEDDELKLVIDE